MNLVQTVEQTDKKWKRRMLISLIPSVVGLATMFAGSGLDSKLVVVGGLVALAGIGSLSVVLILTWWHHG